jgi:cytochrome oxidase Cu insertion factor (SCO1/SenC/PrrC family)
MGGGLQSNNPAVVSAFHQALWRQGLIAVGILLIVTVAWNVTRAWQFRLARSGTLTAAVSGGGAEPAARRLLRVSFGLIWVFDGILQGQASMPLGMIPNVITAAASSSPAWVQHLVDGATETWNYHPVAAAAATVWIQVGIGLFLLVAPRGEWSRLAGLASCAWGLIVWVFGEAFGGIFAPGLTWLFGAPGAVLFYCLAGALIALPEGWWATPRLGRALLRVVGLFFVGMAVLQAWPGRGFWQGQARPSASTGTLTGMVQQMAQTPQPHTLASAVSAFAGFDAAHGWAVNLFMVVALALIGAGFLVARRPWTPVAVIAGSVLCLADWVLVEDLGFLGGVGTDPNSMIPMALIFITAWVAIVRPAPAPDPTVVPITAATPAGSAWDRLTTTPAYTFRVVAALGALGIVVIGAAPMAVAATNHNADPILTEAIDGPAQATNYSAPSFTLVDQNGHPVTSASLRGKVVAITFLDPVCTSDCPVIADEFKQASQRLASERGRVDFVAVDANPRYISPDYLAAFTRQDNLQTVSNWLYLTGTLPQLRALWKAFGVEVDYAPGGAMIYHSEIAYVIDPAGRVRAVLNTDPGPATSATDSSFSETLAAAVNKAMSQS